MKWSFFVIFTLSLYITLSFVLYVLNELCRCLLYEKWKYRKPEIIRYLLLLIRGSCRKRKWISMVRKMPKLTLHQKDFNTRMTPGYDYGVQKSFTLHIYFLFLYSLPWLYCITMLTTGTAFNAGVILSTLSSHRFYIEAYKIKFLSNFPKTKGARGGRGGGRGVKLQKLFLKTLWKYVLMGKKTLEK